MDIRKIDIAEIARVSICGNAQPQTPTEHALINMLIEFGQKVVLSIEELKPTDHVSEG